MKGTAFAKFLKGKI